MGNIKRNKMVARSIVVGGTILAGLGIWSAVTGNATSYEAYANPGIISAKPLDNGPDSQQTQLQITPSVPPAPSTVPPAVQPIPVKPAPIQPAPTITPAPYTTPPAAIRAPRLRTRGS